MSAGPAMAAISRRMRQVVLPDLRRRGGDDAGAPSPPSGRSTSGFCAERRFPLMDVIYLVCRWSSATLGLASGVVDGRDDVRGASLAGHQVDNSDVQRVADVLAEQGVQPDRDVRRLV